MVDSDGSDDAMGAAMMRLIWAGAVLLAGCGGPEAPPPAEEAKADSPPPCIFPECPGSVNESFVVSAAITDDELLSRKALEFTSLMSHSYGLPTLEHTDEYQSKAEFGKASNEAKRSWSRGVLTPKLQLLVEHPVSEVATEYDADHGRLRVNLQGGNTYAFFENRTSSSDNTYGGIRAVRETSTRSGIWFTNVAPISDSKLDGRCSFDYPDRENDLKIDLQISPEEARRARGKLRAMYVVSFEAPASSDNGEWCYEAMETDADGAGILFKGGGMVISSHRKFLNMTAHRMILTDGEKVLHSQTF